VFDFDAVGEQGVADGVAGLGVDDGAFRAEFDVGPYDELGHGLFEYG
jgi:hypothetical protein